MNEPSSIQLNVTQALESVCDWLTSLGHFNSKNDLGETLARSRVDVSFSLRLINLEPKMSWVNGKPPGINSFSCNSSTAVLMLLLFSGVNVKLERDIVTVVCLVESGDSLRI
ncbi:hypothetical protein KQX54_012780 [Cotesia glomerata]|uniref:Uncharacterized protein n=1 Tax=Cotesia glomerata TaxID=32391 RepID=A0AAV7IVV2_COTGL|nr:hypothetical protein KQX54_012780 [Cotesia glomerata]